MPKKNNNVTPQELPDSFELFGLSWRAIKPNFDTFAILFSFPIGLMILSSLLQYRASHSTDARTEAIAISVSVLAIVVSIIIGAALTVAEISSAKGKRITYDQALKTGFKYLWRLIGLYILSVLVIIGGLILLIVPGVFAVQRLLLAPYFLIDRNTGIKQAMRMSNAAGKKFSRPIWGILGVMLLINLGGLMPYIGVIISAVLSFVYLCAPAIRYVQVKSSVGKR